ncbi:MAG TPA: HAMP domain-containing sensor histidine kinase [Spirochaetia bacterium]|nr:HAMP domain-containing sensor histidine kinase [Spirochaetia bacterium]
MKRRRSPGNSVLVFVLAQTSWTALVGLWIAWYVTNAISLRRASPVLTAPMIIQGFNLVTLVLGLFFLGALVIGVTLIFFALTQQVRINRTYDDFIGSVTHELKTPLASLRLHLETLLRRETDAGLRTRLYGFMLGDTERLERLVTTILGVARVEGGTIWKDFEVHPADELFPDLVLKSASDLKLPKGVLVVEGEVDGQIKADPGLVKMVFDVLIDNAVKYSAGPPRVIVRLSSTPRSIALDFTDNGIGIPKESQKRIFAKFYRIDRPDSPVVRGTGLGLFWAREIVQLHHGSLRVQSRGVGLGSTFHVSLPLARERSAMKATGR